MKSSALGMGAIALIADMLNGDGRKEGGGGGRRRRRGVDCRAHEAGGREDTR